MEACLTESQKVPKDDQEILMKQAPWEATKAKETKEVSLGLTNLTKTVKIRAHLDPK